LVGKFVDIEKPTYLELYRAKVQELGGG